MNSPKVPYIYLSFQSIVHILYILYIYLDLCYVCRFELKMDIIFIVNECTLHKKFNFWAEKFTLFHIEMNNLYIKEWLTMDMIVPKETSTQLLVLEVCLRI